MTDQATPPRRPPVTLCILDGWGARTETTDNAIAQAKAPHWKELLKTCPHALLETSGLAVGLPAGQMGNSEVGHMNLGAGRVVMQDLPRIDQAIQDGSLARNPVLVKFIADLKQSGGAAHLMGLLSPGGVHSHQDQIAGLAHILAKAGVPVVIHAFLDGRDTPPSSAAEYVGRFMTQVPEKGVRFGTVGGRYYYMDRDKRWDRVEKAYDAMVSAKGVKAADPLAAIKAAYESGKTDEFILPAIIAGYAGMKDGDGVLMANFRADRAREILTALLDPQFDGFKRGRVVKFAAQLGMASYSESLDKLMGVLFPPDNLIHILAEQVAEAGLAQFHVAETEKYAHVTFFFNGGREESFPGEDRVIVPSPKVATYDEKPEMSAAEVADKLVAAITSGKYGFIVCNFANPDMVGHTGVMSAALKAVETIDVCLGRVLEAVQQAGGPLLITADHGNIELMKDPETGEPYTAHTTGPVPIVLANAPSVTGLADGRLADVAPTILALMGLQQPAEMTGHSLLQPAQGVTQRFRVAV